MADLPTFSDAADSAQAAADAVRDHGRTLIPWLADPPACDACDALMYADVTFDPRLVEYVDCWACRECGREIYRDDPGEHEPAPPRRGAPAIRDLFNQ